MGQHRLLLIAADRLSAYCWHSGRLVCEAEFAAEPQGFQSFVAYLGQHRRNTFRLLSLFAEEGYQREDIPCVKGRDRHALLARKLHQHYYGARLALALSLGRETTGRRDEKLLLTALNSPEQLEPWLDLMTKAEARISALYTLPLLAGALAANTAKAAPLFLLLTLSVGGIHQTLFENARLRFSRLTPVATDNLEKIATACATESARIYQYLVSQRVMTHGDALATLVLVHPGQIAQFRSHCKDTEEIRFIFADLLAESKKHGLKTLPSDSRSDALFLHLMVRKPPHAQFADAALRRFHLLERARLALRSTGMAIFLAALLIAGKESHDYAALREEALQMRLQIEDQRKRYETALRSMPPLPTGIARLRALVGRYDQLEQYPVSPEPMFRRISRALENAPDISIDRIDWQSVQGAGATVVADLHARLPLALVRNQRAQLAAIDSFRTELARDPTVSVQRTRMPFEIESGKLWKSDDAEDSGSDTPRFSLRIAEQR